MNKIPLCQFILNLEHNNGYTKDDEVIGYRDR